MMYAPSKEQPNLDRSLEQTRGALLLLLLLLWLRPRLNALGGRGILRFGCLVLGRRLEPDLVRAHTLFLHVRERARNLLPRPQGHQRVYDFLLVFVQTDPSAQH